MRQPLSLAVAQPWCVGLDVASNVRAHAQAVRAAGARVVVFPELSLTGYELDAPAVATDDPRLAQLEVACAETGSIALVGAPVADQRGRAYIAMLAVDGTRTTVAYRKMWLGTAELERFSPGEEPGSLEVDGWRLGLAIRKDTGVASHSTDTAALGIDAYVAGTVKAASEAPTQRGGPGGSPPNTACGSRWPASPGRRAGASNTPRAGPASAMPPAGSSPKRAPNPATSRGRCFVEAPSAPRVSAESVPSQCRVSAE
ncbi:putative amidohydrolase [Saccharomonospora marina XMU15]|uniref:Putative amidohydrolase n=1 Tax=Saccharomonospora marina XMU15 TaxID=882083 RepID=H5X0L3_9PSEU|nr:carbon-nitrogen hydrolase family protein [Saccharomonospora marina]EHR50809.1 putative amidohydrolase [Saccharomonospora marina XMU15]